MNTDWQTFLAEQSTSIKGESPLLAHQKALAALDYGIVQVSGSDPGKFLQGQLTCDMREVDGKRISLFAYCNTKGRMTASGWVLRNEEDYWLILPKVMVAALIKIMNKFALISRVKLTDISDQYAILGLIDNQMNTLANLPTATNQTQAWDNGWIIKLPGDTPRFWMINTPDYLMSLWQKLTPSLTPISSNTWRLYDIEAGIAQIYPQTAELFTPHMLNYPDLGAVSFRKGCYLGQEIIARAHYLGKTKRLLKPIELTSSTKPELGTPLHNEKNEEVGNIAEIVATSSNHYRGLAVIQETVLEQPIPFQQSSVKIL